MWSGCINADMRADKNKKDQYQRDEKSELPFSLFAGSMNTHVTVRAKTKERSVHLNFIFIKIKLTHMHMHTSGKLRHTHTSDNLFCIV